MEIWKRYIDKCKDQPKLFYGHLNGKLKKRETIDKLKMDGTTYEDPAEMAEVMNNSFHKVSQRKTNSYNHRARKEEGLCRKYS